MGNWSPFRDPDIPYNHVLKLKQTFYLIFDSFFVQANHCNTNYSTEDHAKWHKKACPISHIAFTAPGWQDIKIISLSSIRNTGRLYTITASAV